MNTMSSRILFIVIGLVAVGAAAHGQPAHHYNTIPFDSLNPRPPVGGERYSALTGYAAPDGREYALLGGYHGTHIIDVTTKPIVEVAFIPGPPNGWRELKTRGALAYVVSEGGAGLQIIDLAHLPATATLIRNDTSAFQAAHTVTLEGKYLYVNGSYASAGANGGTLIFSLDDPLHPALVGKWSRTYVHDCEVRNDTLYAATLGSIDIVYLGTDRTEPRLVASVEYPGAGTHNCDVTADGRYILTSDEINFTPKTLKVWDRADVESISKAADYTPAPGEVIHNVHVKGNRAYVAWYTAGTRIIDISRPDDPAELGYFDTFPGSSSRTEGNWEVYPYLPSGKILASDMTSGLFVFTFNGVHRGSVRGVVRDAETNAPIRDAVITLAASGRRIVTDEQGRYRYAGAVDTLAGTAQAVGFAARTVSLELTEADAEHDIVLTPTDPLCTLRVVDAATQVPLPAFTYRIHERSADGINAQENPVRFRASGDSTLNVYVAAWGYRPRIVQVTNPSGAVDVSLERGYTDEAEVDLGWSYAAPGDKATDGRWERGRLAPLPAYPTVTQPATDHTAGLGDEAFFTQPSIPGGWPESGDVDNGVTTLTSPPMDLASSIDPYLHCALWYSADGNISEGLPPDDTMQVLMSVDDGTTWALLERLSASSKFWMTRSYRLRDFVAPGARSRFRIVASDLGLKSWVEAGLDDFSIVDSGLAQSRVPEAFTSRAAVPTVTVAPNPCALSTTIEVSVPAPQRGVRIEITDTDGRNARTMYDGPMSAGAHRYALDLSRRASGICMWRLVLDDGRMMSGPISVVR